MIAEWVGIGITLLIAIGAGIWRLSRIESTIRSDHEDDMAVVHKEISNLAIWARDEFVRNREFYPTVQALREDIKELGQKVETSTNRLSDKLDEIKNKP